ncbi:MAG: P-loop NTPase [Nitrospinaceae bacterium]|jgi:flagellar biosynthesis protein FlhG|nr:P-loop NTPase [Nitrospina sp.]MBT5867579.1 P-loop NTPase [Nitrospinaceae bacterium]
MTTPVNIIAVGGGKGGIGKSVVCTNLAAGMALSGQKVILVDTDFGASNLHALLGISNPEHGFQDFFDPEIPNPSSLLLNTGISNLKFVSGAGDNPGSANIGSDKIAAIIDSIKKLEADTILLDLGPGTNYNVIDFFNISTQGVVLTTPEMTSIMKTFSFIRSALFRRISVAFQDVPEIQKMVDHSNPDNADMESYTTGLLRSRFEESFPDHLEKFKSLINDFTPGLVVNRVRNRKDLMAGNNLLKLVKKFLEVEVTYLGYIIDSDRVRDSIDEMIPFLIKDPQSKPSENLQQIIGALTNTDLQFMKRDGRIFVSKQVRLTSGWEA